MKQKIIKSGNSLAITIPSRFVKIAGLKKGQKAISLIKYKKAAITYHFPDARQLPLKINN